MPAQFEWDSEKADANLEKHGVSFEQASTVFLDVLSVTIKDPDHSDEEDREITVGMAANGSTLVVVHTVRYEKIRLISARKATKQEKKQYEEGKDDER